jgi:hypothetical protein
MNPVVAHVVVKVESMSLANVPVDGAPILGETAGGRSSTILRTFPPGANQTFGLLERSFPLCMEEKTMVQSDVDPPYFPQRPGHTLDLRHVEKITPEFDKRRLGGIHFLCAANIEINHTMCQVPLASIYPKEFLITTRKNFSSSAPNPSLMANSVRTTLSAIMIMDKFFAAGASASSQQRLLHFNVWKTKGEGFNDSDRDALLIYAAVCYVIACKIEMQFAPTMIEMYHMLRGWDNFTGASPLGKDSSGKAKHDNAYIRKFLKRLYAAELLVLDECKWIVYFLTPIDVIEEMTKETCDDPNFMQLRMLTISSVMCMFMDSKKIYNKNCSTVALAVAAMSEAQLELEDTSTPPTQRRQNKKRKSPSGQDDEERTDDNVHNNDIRLQQPCLNNNNVLPGPVPRDVPPPTKVVAQLIEVDENEKLLQEMLLGDAYLNDLVSVFMQRSGMVLSTPQVARRTSKPA